MGGNSVEETPKTYSEVFDSVFPYYLNMGMTYHQFYEESPQLARFYRNANELKRKQRNQELWLQGLYFMDALKATVLNMLSTRSAEKFEYPKEPYATKQKELEERQEREQKEKMERIKARMISQSLNVNKKHRGGEADVNSN